uniref:THUMP domain-containing protein n=1 Tax=Angiostrongylus cantonensis TaxID=6313 RepID=A0A0K0CSP0_ANGCA
MLRSLCGCRMNKVDDKSDVVIRDYRDTVFIYTSSNVLRRSLLGALFTAFENANLKATEMLMLKPSQDVVKKSAMLKKSGRTSSHADELCVVSMWRGEDVFKHALNAVVQFCNTYAFVRGVDIVMTDSTKTTRREGELWIEPLASSLLPPITSANEETAPTGDAPNPENNTATPADVVDVPVIIDTGHDADRMVLVRESSTADTLPVDDDKPPSPQVPEPSPLNNT